MGGLLTMNTKPEFTEKELALIYILVMHEIREGLAESKILKLARSIHDKLEGGR